MLHLVGISSLYFCTLVCLFTRRACRAFKKRLQQAQAEGNEGTTCSSAFQDTDQMMPIASNHNFRSCVTEALMISSDKKTLSKTQEIAGMWLKFGQLCSTGSCESGGNANKMPSQSTLSLRMTRALHILDGL